MVGWLVGISCMVVTGLVGWCDWLIVVRWLVSLAMVVWLVVGIGSLVLVRLVVRG